MKRLGIVQPGRIGDVIICLPIAKWYYDRGYEVIWPIADYIIPHVQNYIEYANFISLPSLDSSLARNIVYSNCNTIIDVTFSFINSNPYNDSIFSEVKDKIPFDQIKYSIAGVPFSEKWKLEFTRNKTAEKELLDKMHLEDPFTIAHLEGSNQEAVYKPKSGERILFVSSLSKSIFDWACVLEKAERVVAIDSCFANFVEQTKIFSKEKILIKRYPDVRPTYTNWKVI